MQRTTGTEIALRRFAAAALAVLLVAAGAATAGTTRGPRFGNAKITSAVRHTDGETDVDVFTESLALGETLEVRVKAAKGSLLLPLVDVDGPDGLPRDVDLRVKRGGSSVRTARIPVDATGRWVVRVSGDAGTEGSYAAKFKIGKARAVTLRDVAVPAPGESTLIQSFDAVDGAVATIKVTFTKKGGVAQLLGVLDPGGGSVPDSTVGIRVRKRSATVAKLPLHDGDGDYGVLLAAPDGPATVTIKIKTKPPTDRPRGKVDVSIEEPYLTPLDEPLEGESGKAVTLAGKRFPESGQPTVWFGELKASVVGVSAGGTRLDVIPPVQAPGTVVAVEVVGPQGQCVRRDAYFGYGEPAEPPPPPDSLRVTALTPPVLAIDGNATQTFEVTVSETAPTGGVWIDLAATGSIGMVAPRIRVPGGRTSTSFLFGATNADRTGEIRATLGTSLAAATVTVSEIDDTDPPGDDEIDLSGWRIAQTESVRNFLIPDGTTLKPGDYIVLGRDSTKGAFEAHWGVTLGANVTFLRSTDQDSGVPVPTVNGREYYDLIDPFGSTVDGPTIAMSSSAGQNLQRTPGTDPSATGSWTVTGASTSTATPGSGVPATAANNGAYISEFSDATGNGAFVYEFVEIHYDGEAE